MKCSNCNNELPEGSVFCANCGTKVEAEVVETPVETPASPVEQPAEAPAEAPANQPAPAESVQENAQPVNAQPVMPQGGMVPPVADKKKTPMGLIIGIAAAAVVALILVIVLISSLFKSNDNQLAYLKDDTIYYVENMTKEDSEVPVCEVSGEEAEEWNDVYLTEDGKYIYYYSKVEFDYDTYDYTGTLNRIKTSKLTDDADKNEDKAEKISSDVKQYTVLEDGKTVVYCKVNGKVVLYDGKKEEDVAKDVIWFSVTEDEKYIVLCTENDDWESGLTIYNIAKAEDAELTDNLSDVYVVGEKEIVYGEYDNDYNETIYKLKYGEDDGEEIISEAYEVGFYNEDEQSVYYLVSRTESRNMYDYIDDPYASTDATLTAPNVMDYLTETTVDKAISEYDYNYYFVEYPDYNDYLYSWDMYEDSETGMLYYYDWDYYYDEELEDWVDVEYRSYYDEETGKWYSLDEAYSEAEDAWWNLENRIELREDLKNSEIEVEMYDLYMWKNGEETLVAENVNEYDFVSEKLVFFTAGEESMTKIPIDDIWDVYDAEYQILYGSYYDYDEEEDDEDATQVVSYATNGTVGTLEIEGEVNNVSVSEDGKSLVLECGEYQDGTLNLYSVSDKEIKFVEAIAEDSTNGAWVENAFYYYKDVNDDMGTLYKYEKGKSEKLVSSAYAGGYTNALFEDGNMMIVEDYEGYSVDCILLLENGEKVKFKGINDYTYVSEDKILYIEDDTLYLYKGDDEDLKIARDVVEYYCSYEYGDRF